MAEEEQEAFTLSFFDEVEDFLVDVFDPGEGEDPTEQTGLIAEIRLKDGRAYGFAFTPEMAAATAHYLVHCLAEMGYDITSELLSEEVEALEDSDE